MRENISLCFTSIKIDNQCWIQTCIEEERCLGFKISKFTVSMENFAPLFEIFPPWLGVCNFFYNYVGIINRLFSKVKVQLCVKENPFTLQFLVINIYAHEDITWLLRQFAINCRCRNSFLCLMNLDWTQWINLTNCYYELLWNHWIYLRNYILYQNFVYIQT